MIFKEHSELSGQHAFLGASKYHWINYDEEKLIKSYEKHLAIAKGTELHELAHRLIKANVKLPRSQKTLNMFVNDAIGYKMESEQVLYYSENCFGTTDAISFKKNMLRIHDLKTGETTASMSQLLIYAALFCLEYNVKPGSIESELRIYQNNDILVKNPESDEIAHVMDKIITFDNLIDRIKQEN